ncbi:hypothetical protein Emin_1372 [Elusimicrobium minutum Pei191]|uniref:HEAT repeat domain-containing protein n=1 Tax=Elusimicrobium minutum (strain Pei191) TaxID=445932 RepID=B2KEH6_ELUMP|nr:HEAT repeat domain-containing protein [Elusimicrobium minutum]ACC98922.1 hypothetical protein Emin_1372 [Elusimicrobium minutum Pei191]
MKKIFLFIFICLFAAGLSAQDKETLKPIMARNLTTEQDFYNAITIFSRTHDQNLMFASAAALIDSVPPAKFENNILSVILSPTADSIKVFFGAVILSSMDSGNKDLIDIVSSGLSSQDSIVKGYAAASLALLGGLDKKNADLIIGLYSFDKVFALKALNALTGYKEKELVKLVKKAAKSKDSSVRKGAAQMLGTFTGEDSTKALFAMLKTESDSDIISDIAFSLSRRPDLAAPGIKKCLSTDSSKKIALGCSLTLGFMEADGIDIIREGLKSSDENTRINSLRAVSVKAKALSEYKGKIADMDLEKQNLKSLIPLIAAMKNDPSKKVSEIAEQTGRAFINLL